MSENHQETHTSGLIYFMPGWIFEAEELSTNAKMTYALLSGLAHGNERKECFPSDEYIAKRLKVRRQQANGYVKELEEFGAIEKRLEGHSNNPFHRIRIITVYLLKKSLRSLENQTLGGLENQTLRGLENQTVKHKGNSNKENGRVDKSTQPKVAKVPKAPKAPPSAEASELCEYFSLALRKKKQNFKIGNILKWQTDCQKILKKRSLDELKVLIDWLGTQDRSFAYIQCPGKLLEKLDQQEILKEADIKKKKVDSNRIWCQFMKNQYPQKLSKMTFDKEYVHNQGEGTALPLNDDPETFKSDFKKWWGIE